MKFDDSQRTQATLERVRQSLKRFDEEINMLSDMLVHESARLNARLAAEEEMHNESAPHGLHAVEEENLPIEKVVDDEDGDEL